MTKRKTDLEWLGDHLRILTEASGRVRSIEPTVYNDFNAWTTLKLIGVKFWQRIYTDIIQEHLELLRKECMAYLEVMAGSGLNRIRDADCYVAGSSILAALVPRKPFHYIVSIESNRSRAVALEKRLMHVRGNQTSFKVFAKEADAVIRDALGELRDRKSHFMAFVDYQGMKGFSRESMDALLREPCDIWFTFFPNIKRSVALSEWDEANLETCRNFFGRRVFDRSATYDDLIGNWTQELLLRRQILYPFQIRSGEGYSYELVFMTKRTKAGSPYVKAADDLKRRLDSIKGDFARMVLQVLTGKQRDLDSYYSGRPPFSL